MHLARHQIAHLDPAAWPDLLAQHPGLTTLPLVVDWTRAGRPLIARYPACEDPAGTVPLGLPLPPSMGKQRLAFAAPPDAVTATEQPPLLADVQHHAPAAWRRTLAALLAIDGEVRCYGSLAWDYLTGLDYLSATSDIDLLWPASTAAVADRLVGAIAATENQAPMRLDGEIVAPSGAAVQWREWAAGTSELLVKDRDGARMAARAAVFA